MPTAGRPRVYHEQRINHSSLYDLLDSALKTTNTPLRDVCCFVTLPGFEPGFSP